MIRFHIIGSNRSIFPGTQYPHTVVIHTKGSGIEASNHRPIRPSYRACLPLVTLQSARLCRFAQSGHSIMAELSVHPVSTNPFPSSLTLSLSLHPWGWLFSRFLRRRLRTRVLQFNLHSRTEATTVFPFVLGASRSKSRLRGGHVTRNSYGSRGIRGSHDALPRSRGINQAYLY